MEEIYDPAALEAAAQQHWRAIDAYRAKENDPRFPKGKFYVCSMLPYPSGKLHMGHMRNYTLNDVVYRFMRSSGYNVMTPMGWDAFGLPAENAAIDKKIAPAKWTRSNIADMKAQFAPMGFAFDWSREVATCDPSYYRWNQWLFLKMLKSGIAYRKTQVVNWDPIDQTVLANEQVVDGRGWRSGAPVEKREIPGYYLAITRYADELLDKVKNDLDGWPAQVRTMQENWIGRSEGVRFAFPYELAGERRLLWVFTTRSDTIMGATFVAIAPEHPLALDLAQRESANGKHRLADFIEASKQGGVADADVATMEKKGAPTGFFVKHPLSGENVEVWIGNYVLMGYGDGAVMGVPAHDERDFVFANNYGLPIKQVVRSSSGAYEEVLEPWAGRLILTTGSAVNSGDSRSPDGRYDYNGKTYQEAVDAVAADLAALQIGEKKVQWRLRDWGISRQRYWGTPIPIIHCDACGVVPVPEKDLPVVLPEDLVPDGSGNPLNKDERFLACTCPECGKPARRETDTMDTFVDSSWYYMRYCCPDAATMVDERNDYWMQMDQYIGGIEHAVLHLLYSRFWTRVMRDLDLVKFDEPFKRLFTQGMLLAHCYYREDANGKKRWFYPAEVHEEFDERGAPLGATAIEDGKPVVYGGIEKMSKSKNNVVEPGFFISRFGADTARAFVMFAGPPDQSAPWSDASAEGVHRFLRRLWSFCYNERERIAGAPPVSSATLDSGLKKSRHEVHAALQQALFDFQRMQYNTVVSATMKILNTLETVKAQPNGAAVLREGMGILLRTLYPIAPHITHALWMELGFARELGDLLDAPMPQPAQDALRQDELELVVQVGGKLRGRVTVAATASEEVIKAAALADAHVQKFVGDKPIRKVIVVPGKLVNIVV